MLKTVLQRLVILQVCMYIPGTYSMNCREITNFQGVPYVILFLMQEQLFTLL